MLTDIPLSLPLILPLDLTLWILYHQTISPLCEQPCESLVCNLLLSLTSPLSRNPEQTSFDSLNLHDPAVHCKETFDLVGGHILVVVLQQRDTLEASLEQLPSVEVSL
jgi:hypothetical protein